MLRVSLAERVLDDGHAASVTNAVAVREADLMAGGGDAIDEARKLCSRQPGGRRSRQETLSHAETDESRACSYKLVRVRLFHTLLISAEDVTGEPQEHPIGWAKKTKLG